MKTPNFPTPSPRECPRCLRARARIARAGFTPSLEWDHDSNINGRCRAESQERLPGFAGRPRAAVSERT